MSKINYLPNDSNELCDRPMARRESGKRRSAEKGGGTPTKMPEPMNNQVREKTHKAVGQVRGAEDRDSRRMLFVMSYDKFQS